MVAEANGKSPTILVVDDDREIVRAIAINLEREGYSVLCAYDGTEALELIAENDVKLIILDIMMPRLDGLSVLMKMREGNNIPVIHCQRRVRIPINSRLVHWRGRLCYKTFQSR